MNTQATRLLNHLSNGKPIDRLSALIDLGIFELSARIIDIKNAGYKICKVRKKIVNRFGEQTSVVEYSLEAKSNG